MSAGPHSIRSRGKTRRPRVTLVLRIPMQLKHLMMLMTTAEREHLVARAVKQALKETQRG